MVHQSISYLGNATKISTPITLSPYLQLIHIEISPLRPLIIIHCYMLSHLDDLSLLTDIKQNEVQIIFQHPTILFLMVGDFNIDIFMIGRTSYGHPTPPNSHNEDWYSFTHQL